MYWEMALECMVGDGEKGKKNNGLSGIRTHALAAPESRLCVRRRSSEQGLAPTKRALIADTARSDH